MSILGIVLTVWFFGGLTLTGLIVIFDKHATCERIIWQACEKSRVYEILHGFLALPTIIVFYAIGFAAVIMAYWQPHDVHDAVVRGEI